MNRTTVVFVLNLSAGPIYFAPCDVFQMRNHYFTKECSEKTCGLTRVKNTPILVLVSYLLFVYFIKLDENKCWLV